MRIDELSDKEKKELSEAFSKNQLMVKKRTSAEKFFNWSIIGGRDNLKNQ
jgi:hypothetical protein